MEPEFKFEVTNGISFGSFSNILDVVQRQTGVIAKNLFPTDEQQSDRFTKQAELETAYMACLVRYLSWARPTGWVLDHVHYDTGGFGILFSGQYTCLVMMQDNGNVSGHS